MGSYLRLLFAALILLASADVFATTGVRLNLNELAATCFVDYPAACGGSSISGYSFSYTAGQCQMIRDSDGGNVGNVSGVGCNTDCSGEQVRNESGICADPAPPVECPPPGTQGPMVSFTKAAGQMYCSPVNIEGCTYDPCASGATGADIDGEGNNCADNGDGSLTCWAAPVATGENSEPCEGEDCPEATPVTEPQQVGASETATQTQTNPETGATTTTEVEKKSEVHEGGSTETTTETTTSNAPEGTTTTVTETKVNRWTDGTEVTTTQTTVTNPDGTSTVTISGTSTKPAGELASGEEKDEEEAAEKSGSASADCSVPPQCSGDPQLCAILQQQWETMCHGSEYELDGEFYTPDGVAPASKLDQALGNFKSRIQSAQVVQGLDNFFSVPSGGSCPVYSVDAWVFSITLDQWCDSSIPWGLVSACVMIVALLLAARIAFT